MAVSINKNSAFSLIEILQTIILIGIIAGISISFFRSVNTDTKLRDSTEIMLYHAIREVNKQMCSDQTPICLLPSDLSQWRFVRAIYPVTSATCANNAGTYDPNMGLCTVSPNIGGCPANTELYIDRDGNASCISTPTSCGGNGVVMPAHQALCVHDPNTDRTEIQWNARILRTIGTDTLNDSNADNQVNEICYRLWDMINHKPQGGSTIEDLKNTCVVQTNACFEDNDDLDANSCNRQNSTTANMILPNGVRLYNMSRLGFPRQNNAAGEDNQHIYIKYDRNPQISTHNLSTTSSMFNAVVFGQPNNLRQARNNTPDNSNDGLEDHAAIPQTYITEVNGGSGGSDTVPYIPPSINALMVKDGVITPPAE